MTGFIISGLTQAAFSFSREDAKYKFLSAYNEAGILEDNPLEVLCIKGVGQLMKMAAAQAMLLENQYLELNRSACGIAEIIFLIGFCLHRSRGLRC